MGVRAPPDAGFFGDSSTSRSSCACWRASRRRVALPPRPRGRERARGGGHLSSRAAHALALSLLTLTHELRAAETGRGQRATLTVNTAGEHGQFSIRALWTSYGETTLAYA